jgi:hypothetical protein
MTNRKSKTIRKIGPASTSAILPSGAARHNCPPSTEPKSSNTEHAPLQVPINPPIHKSNNPFAPRTRNGKVARLPYAVRDMINRMLRNNIPHSQIVDALDELQFKVTERNISNWKTRGGYRDWCIAQERALETRLLQDNLLEQLRKNDASQLAEVGLQLAATELSQFFLKSETRQQLNTDPEKFARTIGILCRLARQIHILQKYRDQSAKELGSEHNPERSKRDTEEFLESIRNSYSAEKPAQSIKEPEVPHRNFLPKNGYPANPPQHEPDEVAIRAAEVTQELINAIAARNARPQSPPQICPSPHPENSDDSIPTLPESPPA